MDASLQLSALQLEGYYITDFAFRVRALKGEPQFNMQGGIGVQHVGIFDADPPTVNVQAAVLQHPQEARRWQNVLTITSQTPPERNYPYEFQITLVGYFTVAEQVPPEQVELFVKVNAASILYSAAREYLATTTGRGPLPSVVLPTVVFAITPEPVTEAKKEGKKTAKKATKKRTTKKAGSKKRQR